MWGWWEHTHVQQGPSWPRRELGVDLRGGVPARLPVPPRSDGPLLQFLSSNLTFQMTQKIFIKVEK